MNGLSIGGLRGAATRLGVTVEEYTAKRFAGLKWCTHCSEWHPIAAFSVERARPDGLSSKCRTAQARVRQERRRAQPARERKPTNTVESAARVAAARIGVPLAEYRTRRAAGYKWCYACRAWHTLTEFHADKSRVDGLANKCREAMRRGYKRRVIAEARGN